MAKKQLLDNDYPYDGAVKWNTNCISDIIKKNKQNKSVPDFDLERVEIHPTSFCQYKCQFCYGTNFKHKKKIDLSLDLIEKNVFQSIEKNKRFTKADPIIILAGLYSEPLAYSRITELIELIGQYNFRFSIYTNGGYMNKDIMNAICRATSKVKKSRLNYISFNITGAILHGQYDLIVEKIKCLIKMREEMNTALQINVPILIYKNFFKGKELEDIQDTMLQIGVDKIRYSIPQVPVSTKIQEDTTNVRMIKKLEQKGRKRVYFRSKSGKQFDNCYVMAHTVSIDASGSVYPCSQTCSAFFNKLCYGNIKEKNLAEIWSSEERRELFNNFDELPVYCRCNHTDNEFNTICSSLDS